MDFAMRACVFVDNLFTTHIWQFGADILKEKVFTEIIKSLVQPCPAFYAQFQGQ
jgi:hypothetical protein